MDAVLIIVLVVVVLVVVLAVGGAIAQRRRMDRNRKAFERSLEEVNRELAAARADDRGWERETLDAAARDIYAQERPGTGEADLALVRVLDRPGTDDDKAVYRVRAAGRDEELTLGRRDGAWVLDRLG
jgi:type II secretory pathway pseudopilin PulG